MNTVSLVPVSRSERGILENLAELYCHDWSEFLPLRVGDDGRFRALNLSPYFFDDEHHAFFIRLGDETAGFLLVVNGSRLNGAKEVFDMAEFFVLRAHRARGVGRSAALAAFARFEGPWEVRQRDENPIATAFWRRVIRDYTGGQYEEIRHEAAEWKGPVQRFVARR